MTQSREQTPAQPLTELVYSSDTPEPMTPEAVKALLEHAREKNTRMQVTGLLCYDGRRFLQIIEGESDVILDLFHEIQNDPRHTNVHILHDGEVERRAFSDWKMAYEPVPSGMLPSLGRSIARASLDAALRGETDLGTSAGQRIFSLFMDELYGGDEEPPRRPVPA